MDYQDLNEVKIGKRVNNTQKQTVKSQSQFNAAVREGLIVGQERKAVGNKVHVPDGSLLAKVDRSDDVVVLKKVDMAVGQAIQRGRLDKKLSQSDLAKRLNQKPIVIQEYERGSAQPDQKLLGKMEVVLGIKLRGSNIGQPLGPKKKN